MDLEALMHEQDGLITRRQVLEEGGSVGLIQRHLRRNEWSVIHPGAYVSHTGAPTDEELRMAAVLYASPAALAGESALIAHGARNIRARSIRVVVETTRRVTPPAGVKIQRVHGLEDRVIWNRTPPRLRVEDAVVETASRRWRSEGESAAIAIVADVCQQRLSTPGRLHEALERYPRLAGRAFLVEVLADVATGTYSVLEHRYLT